MSVKNCGSAVEFAEIMDAVTDKVPVLIRSLRDSLYSPEAGRQLGQAVGAFYKELVDAGMDPQQALSITQDYLSALKSFSQINSDLSTAPAEES